MKKYLSILFLLLTVSAFALPVDSVTNYVAGLATNQNFWTGVNSFTTISNNAGSGSVILMGSEAIKDANGVPALSWYQGFGGRSLLDTSDNPSVYWNTRQLYLSDGLTPTLDWQNLLLLGNWTATNVTATGSFAGTHSGNGGGLTNLNAGAANTNVFANLSANGDSLTGYGGQGTPTTPWPTPFLANLEPYIVLHNYGAGGQSLLQFATNNAYATNGLLDSYNYSHVPNIFTLWLGHNDIYQTGWLGQNFTNAYFSGVYTNATLEYIYSNICFVALTNGSKVLAFTISGYTGFGATQETNRLLINNYIRSNWQIFATALVDVDAMFPLSSFSTNTLDGQHLTPYSEAVLATNINNIIISNRLNVFSLPDMASRPNLLNAYGQLQPTNLPAGLTIAGPGGGVSLGSGITLGNGAEVAIGQLSISENYGTAVGGQASANGTRTIAIGNQAIDNGVDSFVIGGHITSSPGGGSFILGGFSLNNPAGSMTSGNTNCFELGSGTATNSGFGYIFGYPYFQFGSPGINTGAAPISGNGSGLTNLNASSANYNTNPHLPSAVTIGTSPWSFTNATTSMLECYFSGSTAYSVKKNGISVFASLGSDGYFLLQPTNQCTVTYTVAPTFYTNSLF